MKTVLWLKKFFLNAALAVTGLLTPVLPQQAVASIPPSTTPIAATTPEPQQSPITEPIKNIQQTAIARALSPQSLFGPDTYRQFLGLPYTLGGQGRSTIVTKTLWERIKNTKGKTRYRRVTHREVQQEGIDCSSLMKQHQESVRTTLAGLSVGTSKTGDYQGASEDIVMAAAQLYGYGTHQGTSLKAISAKNQAALAYLSNPNNAGALIGVREETPPEWALERRNQISHIARLVVDSNGNPAVLESRGGQGVILSTPDAFLKSMARLGAKVWIAKSPVAVELPSSLVDREFVAEMAARNIHIHTPDRQGQRILAELRQQEQAAIRLAQQKPRTILAKAHTPHKRHAHYGKVLPYASLTQHVTPMRPMTIASRENLKPTVT